MTLVTGILTSESTLIMEHLFQCKKKKIKNLDLKKMKYGKHNCTKKYLEKIFLLILLSNSAEVALQCYIY